ncbi:phytoene desaturase [Sphaerosporella brunnea]|uniref:Phytoene desaturase n=1 Tax=Sphaerosporella brunnea TaxID=1250544 RepID=A0A5J5F116_9PEZI|nr:phytoene desaturase [Sphaerosporella brunnea]
MEKQYTPSQQKKKTAIVVGAGVGGVATAARLQMAGFDVTVIEKNDFTGGRCSLIHKDGHRFDQGPSLLLLPNLFHETFRDLGTSLQEEGVELLKCEPNYNIYFKDGERVEMSSDLARMKSEIERIEGPEGWAGYLGFLKESGQHYDISYIHVLKRNFEGFTSMLRREFVGKVLALHTHQSVYTRAAKYFKSERLRRVFTFAAMYLGMSPYDAPGTYSLLQYSELAEGIWYPRGGFHRIPETLVDISKRNGATYRLNTPVKQVLLSPDSKRATGVLLADGTSLHADVVVLNADLVHSYTTLLPPSPRATALKSRPHSCSSISLYWSLSSKAEKLSTHNIFLADSYKESFDSIFKRQDLPDELSFYVNVPSRIDPTAAPEGGDSLVVLVPCGHITSESKDWPANVARVREEVLTAIQQRTGEDLRPKIVSETVNTPEVWQEKFNLHQGAILGMSHSFFNVLVFRPTTKHPEIEGCYFVGASTHPGTGVPICLAGAKITTEQILKNEGMPAPWVTNEQFHKQRPRTEDAPFWALVALVVMVGGWVAMRAVEM